MERVVSRAKVGGYATKRLYSSILFNAPQNRTKIRDVANVICIGEMLTFQLTYRVRRNFSDRVREA